MKSSNPSKPEADPECSPRERNRAKTASALRLALKELVGAKRGISISAVAAASGVTPSLVHNKYPDIAEAIRREKGKTTRAQRDEKRDQLAEAQTALRTLRGDKKQLQKEVKKLASINESLRRRLAEAQAIANSRNVVALQPGSGRNTPRP